MLNTQTGLLQEQLQHSMQHELLLTRELLGNLHREEQSLIVQDTLSWNQVMSERSIVLDKLKTLRTERIETATKLAHSVGASSSYAEEQFPLNLEGCCEILHLSDQLIALTERMNYQQNRNHYLMHHVQRFTPPPPTTPQKTQVKVATYSEDDEENY